MILQLCFEYPHLVEFDDIEARSCDLHAPSMSNLLPLPSPNLNILMCDHNVQQSNVFNLGLKPLKQASNLKLPIIPKNLIE